MNTAETARIIHARRRRCYGSARSGRKGTHRVAPAAPPGNEAGRSGPGGVDRVRRTRHPRPPVVQECEGRTTPIEVGIERVLREEANFSYRNAVVADVDGRVAAALLAYRLPEHSDVNLDELPDLLRPLEELELKAPGTFYINILAAYPEYRGLGLGTSLLKAAHMLASEALRAAREFA